MPDAYFSVLIIKAGILMCNLSHLFSDFNLISVFDQKFVTRAIRIMEWIANMDLSGYQNQSGLTAIINRLEVI